MKLLFQKNSQPFQALSFLLLAAISILNFSCKDPDEVGLSIQPPGDKLNVVFTDSAQIVAYTIKEIPLETDENSLSLFGCYDDPVFGKVSASFYTQFALSSNNIKLGASLVLDSAVLTLAYKGGYGENNELQTLKVYELEQTLDLDSNYKANSTALTSGIEIANKSFIPNLKDSIVVNGSKKPPHLRIRLDDAFANERFMNHADSSYLVSTDAFQDYFKGLYVAVDTNVVGAGIIYFDLLSSNSGLTLYYSNSTGDSLSHTFVIKNLECARFGHFEHNYSFPSATPVALQLNDNSVGQDKVYIQAMSGVKTRILFPDLKELLNNENVGINSAELVLTVEEDADTTMIAPVNLYLETSNSSGGQIPPVDAYLGASYFGGAYDKTKKQYKFNIARHVQDIVSGKTDYGLNIIAVSSSITANRVVLKGLTNSEDRIKLNITFTKP